MEHVALEGNNADLKVQVDREKSRLVQAALGLPRFSDSAER
jgi:hypothetical protein